MMFAKYGYFLLLLTLPAWGGAPYYWNPSSFLLAVASAERSGHARATVWAGMGEEGTGWTVFVLPLNAGYSDVDDQRYYPVQSVATLIGIGSYLLYDWQESSAVRPAYDVVGKMLAVPMVAGLAAMPLSGTRISFGSEWASIFAGHRFELYAPHWGWALDGELGLRLAIVECSVFRRFSSVGALDDAGLRLGLGWRFKV